MPYLKKDFSEGQRIARDGGMRKHRENTKNPYFGMPKQDDNGGMII